MEYITNYLSNLDTFQNWYVLIFTSSVIVFILYLVKKHGIPYKDGYLFKSKPDAESKLPDYLKAKTWFKEISFVPKGEKKAVKLGTIGFIKDVVIFKFFGNFWNSASTEGKEGYDLFEAEFYPPNFLSDEQKKEMECFVFVENCNLQTKLFSIIRQKSKNWKKVFVVASRDQIRGQELESLLPENGGPDNVEILEIPLSI